MAYVVVIELDNETLLVQLPGQDNENGSCADVSLACNLSSAVSRLFQDGPLGLKTRVSIYLAR
jgi:hypothetical protein